MNRPMPAVRIAMVAVHVAAVAALLASAVAQEQKPSAPVPPPKLIVKKSPAPKSPGKRERTPEAARKLDAASLAKTGEAGPIDDATWAGMQGKSWRPNMGCPRREDLALLKIPYVDFFGQEQTGHLIVAAVAAQDVLGVFAELHRLRFPIASMRLVDVFGGNDNASMAANNTSAFNCRAVTGGTRLSEHSFGLAIDLNPIQNPYVVGGRVMPPEGQKFVGAKVRAAAQPGMVMDRDAVVTAFARIGWKWGGAWTSPKDYQHFSKSGR